MKRTLRLAAICSLILLVYLLITDPNELPSAFLVVPFIGIYVILFLVVASFLKHYGLVGSKRLRLSLIIAIVPVLLLVLQSLGQLTIRDTFALTALLCVTYFYIVRFDSKPA